MAGNGRVKKDGQSAFFYAIEKVMRATDPKDFETALKILQGQSAFFYAIEEVMRATDPKDFETALKILQELIRL